MVLKAPYLFNLQSQTPSTIALGLKYKLILYLDFGVVLFLATLAHSLNIKCVVIESQ